MSLLTTVNRESKPFSLSYLLFLTPAEKRTDAPWRMCLLLPYPCLMTGVILFRGCYPPAARSQGDARPLAESCTIFDTHPCRSCCVSALLWTISITLGRQSYWNLSLSARIWARICAIASVKALFRRVPTASVSSL